MENLVKSNFRKGKIVKNQTDLLEDRIFNVQINGRDVYNNIVSGSL